MNALPPTVIAFASPKGGVGKSTTCLAIAGALAAQGRKVHIVDFDQTETLWRWYSSNEAARAITRLTVEHSPKAQIAEFVTSVWHNAAGYDYVLIDLAGALTDLVLHIAAFAHLTITPSKLNEPDILEAHKLTAKLQAIGAKIGKPLEHRVLLNEVPNILAGFQIHLLNQIDSSPLKRFDTLIHYRAPYPESFLTGVPPHFADANRAPIAKAVQEIDHLVTEILAVCASVPAEGEGADADHPETREAA